MPFRFYRIVVIAGKLWRRLGKALAPKPFVAISYNECTKYGRCAVRRQNCFRGSSTDLCQVCLRCNVDLQNQRRSFPEAPEPVAADHKADTAPSASRTKPASLPGLLGLLVNRVSQAKSLIGRFATAVRSSHVAAYYDAR